MTSQYFIELKWNWFCNAICKRIDWLYCKNVFACASWLVMKMNSMSMIFWKLQQWQKSFIWLAMIHGSTLAKCKQNYRKSRLIDSRDHGWLIMDVNWPPFEICWSIWYTLTKVMSSKQRILHRFSNPFTDTLPKLSFDFGTKLRLTPLLLLLWYHEFHQEEVCPNTIGSVIRLCFGMSF